MPQLNVQATEEFKAALYEAKAKLLKNGKKVTLGQLVTRAWNFWVTFDGIGLPDAWKLAKIYPDKVQVEGKIEGKPYVITIEGPASRDVFSMLLYALEQTEAKP